jgi:DNA-binding SARP family transcriptional activator/tetratricopeptide (TPR) repeat protein
VLRLWLCGRLAGDRDGEPLAMPAADRARALIGWLALNPGQHPRAVVAARLWPEVPEDSARASLRTAVWSLRQSWGSAAADVLEASRTGLGWRDGQVWVDALADPLEHDGELLPGVHDDWARTAREEHRDRLLHGLATAAATAEAEGRIVDAVRSSRRRCALSPLDELAHRELLRRLELAGDRAGAVVAAREFTALLRGELGVRPSPATRAAQSSFRVAAGGDAPVRLFGRGGELATLMAAWRTAADGRGGVVVLTGEAGIGKTTLIAEVAHRVGLAGGRCAIGAGGDVGGETPFAVWLELVRALLASVAPVPASARWPVELSRLSPELGARLGRPEPPTAVAAPELERLRVFESTLRLVEWSCTDRPVLIALDDAHSADRASLRLTAHIGRRLAGLPLLLVLTRRDRPVRPELDALLADLARRGVPITEVDVGPITDADVAALAAAAVPPGTDQDVVRRVVGAAEGNPLLAVESTRALLTGGGGPPPSLRAGVRAMVGRLPRAGQELAGLLAAAGRPVTGAELGALAVDGLADAVAVAVDAGLLSRRDGRLGFRHALLRDVVYADLPDPPSAHLAVAAALDDADRAEIARHLVLAGRPVEAAREWAAAAAYARSVGALAEAADFLGRAVECSPRDGELWLDLQEVHALQGRREPMEQAWERALALLPPAEHPRAWCRRGRQLRTVICHPEGAFAAYRQAEDELDLATPPGVRADTMIGLAWSHAVAGDADAVDGLLAAAAAALTTPPGPRTAADIAEIRILGLIRRGLFDRCAEVADAYGPGTVRARLPERAYGVWINAACALACGGDHERALAMADQAVAATEGVPVLLLPCLAARAHLLARLGRHDEAERTMDRHRAHAERLDAPGLLATTDHDAGLVALAGGRYAAAAALLRSALDQGAQVSRPAAALARAEALARCADADGAAAQLRAMALEPVGRADQPWTLVPRMAFVQGLIAAVHGDRALAGRRFDEAAQSWRALLVTARAATGEDYLAVLVDLGRPPVVGLVQPERELAAIDRERALLAPSVPAGPPDSAGK